MVRPLVILWLLVLAIAGAALALTAPEATAAHRRARAEFNRLGTAKSQAAEIVTLRGEAPPWAERPPPGPVLATRISQALAAAGLPAAALVSLSPAAETDAGAGSGLEARRRRAVLTLGGVTLPQVGNFLASWRDLEPGWIVASIDLVQDSSHRAPSGGGDLPLRAAIALETLYVNPADDTTGDRRR